MLSLCSMIKKHQLAVNRREEKRQVHDSEFFQCIQTEFAIKDQPSPSDDSHWKSSIRPDNTIDKTRKFQKNSTVSYSGNGY